MRREKVCRLKDGPLCNPLDHYFTHSTAIYNADSDAPRDPEKYGLIHKKRTLELDISTTA